MLSRPNWREPAQYPTVESFKEPHLLANDLLHTSKSWAWQFLRRNPQYQETARKFGTNGRAHVEAAREFGLSFLLPLSLAAPEFIPFEGTFGLREFTQNTRGELTKSPNFIALEFDLTKSLTWQLRMAQEQLLAQQRRRKLAFSRKRLPEYIRYLRLIDARAEGVRHRDIATVFIAEGLYSSEQSPSNEFPGDLHIERDWKVARKLLNQGYLNIAFAGP